jgi:hypothetical protein
MANIAKDSINAVESPLTVKRSSADGFTENNNRSAYSIYERPTLEFSQIENDSAKRTIEMSGEMKLDRIIGKNNIVQLSANTSLIYKSESSITPTNSKSLIEFDIYDRDDDEIDDRRYIFYYWI